MAQCGVVAHARGRVEATRVTVEDWEVIVMSGTERSVFRECVAVHDGGR